VQSAGVPLEEKARVAPGTTHGVAETALCIEMECDVLSIEGGGTVRTARRAGRAARRAGLGKVSEGIRDKYLRVVREATGPRGDSRAHLLVGSDDVDVEPPGPVERLDDLRESGGGDAVVVDHEDVRAPRRARVANLLVHHLSFACVYSPDPRALGASPEKRPRSLASSSALARYSARSSGPRRSLVRALARASVPSAASRGCVSE
jgi:hypothetical protein